MMDSRVIPVDDLAVNRSSIECSFERESTQRPLLSFTALASSSRAESAQAPAHNVNIDTRRVENDIHSD